MRKRLNKSKRESCRTNEVSKLLTVSKKGIYCAAGDFYIDPWGKVDRAIITHAHSDHARSGMKHYLCSIDGEEVLKLRIGFKSSVQALDYGEAISMNGVRVSLHPAGHILGSSQVRIELDGRVEVVSGDYKTAPDPTCKSFEPIKCHLFVTESTFGLPIYQWPTEQSVFQDVNHWWSRNRELGRTTVVSGYSLGKAQRILAGLSPSIGPIILDNLLIPNTEAYRNAGVKFPEYLTVQEASYGVNWGHSIVVCGSSLSGLNWQDKLVEPSSAFFSGWMATRKRRKASRDKGFVLSDHVDWPSLLSAVKATGAQEVWVTHGFTKPVATYLSELGLDAKEMPTPWASEDQPLERSAEREN